MFTIVPDPRSSMPRRGGAGAQERPREGAYVVGAVAGRPWRATAHCSRISLSQVG
jgi:hypothetical protein